MAVIDLPAGEIHAKVVFFGPELSGKTTSLRVIEQGVPLETRGSLRSIASESARTIFSDSLRLDLGERLGFRLYWHLYSVPGQHRSAGVRAAVVHGADGVVFVADAGPLRMAENLASFAELGAMLAAQGRRLDDFPLVLACNKSDLAEAMAPAELASMLGVDEAAAIRASAINGEGVFEALRAVSKRVAAGL